MDMVGMNPAERQLVTDVKAGKEADLSAYPEPTLRADVLHEILLGRVKDVPNPSRVQVRGAIIEGELDLSDVPATVMVDLANCQAARICLHVKRPERLRALPRPPGGIGIGQYITALAFSYVVIKVIWIARGDIPTALGVFNSAGLATVIVGGLLSALPVISATALGWATFQISSRWLLKRSCPRDTSSWKPRFRSWILNRSWPRDTSSWIALSVAGVACFFLTPWPVMASGAFLGLVCGITAGWVASKTKKPDNSRRRWAGRIGMIGGLTLVGIASFYLVLNPLLYAVWLPHETLKLTKPNPQPMVGYVLSDGNGWVSVLRTGVHRIYRFPSQEVLTRDLCMPRSISMPAMPDWFNNPTSLWNIVLPEEGLHTCP
jgi:hypothetical protein